MSHDKVGPKELAQRALTESKRTRLNKTSRKVGITKASKPLIPFAGKDKLVRGGRNSPNTRSITRGKT